MYISGTAYSWLPFESIFERLVRKRGIHIFNKYLVIGFRRAERLHMLAVP